MEDLVLAAEVGGLSAALSLRLLLFGWASYLLGAHPGPTYPENIHGRCQSVVTSNYTLLLLLLLLNVIWRHQVFKYKQPSDGIVKLSE